MSICAIPKLTPYWWEEAPLSSSQATNPTALPQKVDIAIIGAGFTGLTAALILAKAGWHVVLFDAQRAGEGASSRNGGICSGNLKPSYRKLVNLFGEDFAKSVYGEGIAARKSLARLIEDEKIECHFSMNGRFSGANKPKHYDSMARECDDLVKHLGIEAYMIPRAEQHKEIGSDLYYGGAVRSDIGSLHPGLFHKELLARVKTLGVEIYDQCPITKLTPSDTKKTTELYS
ncbi:MAG: FAD-dependent oxidoreductase, partial [Alphaproteobacteria bacterium]|nr:FAD-dependent oxidoreductase [Alphaproteobacteria bacterium]